VSRRRSSSTRSSSYRPSYFRAQRVGRFTDEGELYFAPYAPSLEEYERRKQRFLSSPCRDDRVF